MSTDCHALPALPLPIKRTLPSWRRKLLHFVDAWRAHQQARAERRIDAWFRRERDAHERFLARAGDRYELERMERDWERRHSDLWRVY